MAQKRVGVLALQGDFEAHQKALAAGAPRPSRCARPRISIRSTA